VRKSYIYDVYLICEDEGVRGWHCGVEVRQAATALNDVTRFVSQKMLDDSIHAYLDYGTREY
jgi:hypothetical protein